MYGCYEPAMKVMSDRSFTDEHSMMILSGQYLSLISSKAVFICPTRTQHLQTVFNVTNRAWRSGEMTKLHATVKDFRHCSKTGLASQLAVD